MPTRLIRRLFAIAICVACRGPLAARAQGLYGTQGPGLNDQARPFDLASLNGGFSVLTLAYGACRRVCSTSLRVMQNLQSLADARGVRMNFVVIGLDPSQDKPRDWDEFRVDRKLTRANWQFLAGAPTATRQLAQRSGVRYWRYGEHTLHEFKIVLISPDGKLLRGIVAFDADPAGLLP